MLGLALATGLLLSGCVAEAVVYGDIKGTQLITFCSKRSFMVVHTQVQPGPGRNLGDGVWGERNARSLSPFKSFLQSWGFRPSCSLVFVGSPSSGFQNVPLHQVEPVVGGLSHWCHRLAGAASQPHQVCWDCGPVPVVLPKLWAATGTCTAPGSPPPPLLDHLVLLCPLQFWEVPWHQGDHSARVWPARRFAPVPAEPASAVRSARRPPFQNFPCGFSRRASWGGMSWGELRIGVQLQRACCCSQGLLPATALAGTRSGELRLHQGPACRVHMARGSQCWGPAWAVGCLPG